MIFFEHYFFTLAKVVIYQSIHSSDLASFLTHRTDTSPSFHAFQTSLGFLGTTQHYASSTLCQFTEYRIYNH